MLRSQVSFGGFVCVLGVALSACAPSVSYVKTREAQGPLRARPASSVDVYFGTNPSKDFVSIGYFERPPNDYIEESSQDVVNDLRRRAGYIGCDGLVIPPRTELEALAKSTTEQARALCVMYVVAAKREAASAPVPAPVIVQTPSEPAASAPVPQRVTVKTNTQLNVAEKSLIKAKSVDAPSDEAACAGGNGDACIRLGAAAEASKDAALAEKHYARACAAHAQRGCTHLGILKLMAPPGVSKDEASALELFTRACATDDAIACRYQGLVYVEGRGQAKNVVGGMAYLQKACAANDAWSCFRLSGLWASGSGVAKDSSKAEEYRALACSKGYQAACQ